MIIQALLCSLILQAPQMDSEVAAEIPPPAADAWEVSSPPIAPPAPPSREPAQEPPPESAPAPSPEPAHDPSLEPASDPSPDPAQEPALSPPAGAVVVLPEPGYRVEPEAVFLAARFLADAYGDACHTAVADVARTQAWRNQQRSMDAALDQLGERTVITLELITLGEDLLVSAARYESAEPSTAHQPGRIPSQRIKLKAAGLDELPVVGERLGESLCRQVPLEASQSYHTILSQEAQAPKRVFGSLDVGARLNLVMPLSDVALQPMMSGGVALRWEAERFFLELGGGALIPATGVIKDAFSYGGVYADFGAAYFLYADAVGVYLGGGILPSLLAPSNGELGVHFAPYATLGLELLRYSTARVVIDFRVAQHVLPFHSGAVGGSWDGTSGQFISAPQATYFPTELQLGFSLLF